MCGGQDRYPWHFGIEDDEDASHRARANSVRTYLVERGVASDRITAIGKGQTQPVASNDNATGRTENRRVEIIIQNDNKS